MQQRLVLWTLLWLTLYTAANAQPSAGINRRRAETLQQAIYQHLYNKGTQLFIQTTDPAKNHNPHADLWGLCAMVQAANEMETLQPDSPFLRPVMKAIGEYYYDSLPAPGYASYVVNEKIEDRYYDDNQWIGIACMDAYARTKEKKYLETGRLIYNFMMTGFDTVTGGGLYWKEGDRSTKNTCSNGPGVLLALQLYNATHQQPYLDTALMLYNWTNKHLLSPEGVYWDAIKPLKQNHIDSATYTYNTGTMLEANVKLWHITHQQRYLSEAKRLAEGSYRHFFRRGRFPPSGWFNAVLLRGYEALYAVDKNPRYLKAMQQYADTVWQHDRDAQNLLGKPPKALLMQAGMLEIYARLARWEQSLSQL